MIVTYDKRNLHNKRNFDLGFGITFALVSEFCMYPFMRLRVEPVNDHILISEPN